LVNHAPVIGRQQFVAPAGRTACWLVSQAESLKASSSLWQLSWKSSSDTQLLLGELLLLLGMLLLLLFLVA